MKLLFDQNLSRTLPRRLADIFPDSVQVAEIGLTRAPDEEVWTYARQHGFVIVSKDADFQHRSTVFGHPPKFVWLRVGNCPTGQIETLLRTQSVAIHTFALDEVQSLLVLP